LAHGIGNIGRIKSMTKINTLGGMALTGAVAALAWASAPTSAEASSAKDNWKAMERCAAIADADTRHACSDDVMRRAGLLEPTTTASTAEPARAPEAAPSAPAPQTAAVVPAPEAPPAPARPPSAPPPKPKLKKASERYHVEVTLAKAVLRGDGKLVVTTADGVVWQQLYSDVQLPMPRAGQSMRVWEGKLGGYMCRIEKSPTFRCTPAS
jgi:hypothetical protein